MRCDLRECEYPPHHNGKRNIVSHLERPSVSLKTRLDNNQKILVFTSENGDAIAV